ncbi:LacI family DNA-binding transcriptional regulator [Georgenia halophila]|uniref:LacI family DNA-binding transcriptional regulator n=1 Tax=Georgenia halophila TaxID=620889 RepID=A0ABP8LG48_9MICO
MSTTTIAMIAKEAGVSVPTVSKVLNGRPDVAQTTRQHVEQVLEKHQYRRRNTSRSAGSRLVDLVFHELGSAWSVEIICGVERAAHENGLNVVLSDLAGEHRPRQAWLDGVIARRPMGVILVLSDLDPGQRRQLVTRNIPFVVVDTAGELPAGVPAVGSANWNGGLVATRHLLELGHRRIGVVTGPADVMCSRQRTDGHRAALDEAGIPYDPALILSGKFTAGSGYEQGLRLLDRPDRPTAIFAGNDLEAMGLLRAARDRGLRVPEDLSIVGYDDLQVAAWTTPRLTTVRQPLVDMAHTATTMLVRLAAGKPLTMPRIDLATELVVRESTAPPAA